MRKFSVVILIVVLAMLTAPADASVAAKARAKGKPVAELCELNSEQTQCTVPLVAGQNTPVGEVIVDLAGDPVVTFVINDPNWFITETHVYLGGEPPAKSAPGSFDFQHSGLDAQIDQFSAIEVASALGEECLYVAAHAVVEKRCFDEEAPADLEGFSIAIPTQVTMTANYPGPQSYWEMTVSGGTVLDGAYPAWCIDKAHGLASGTEVVADVYSSYESLPADLVVGQEALDKVNWIINQGFVGQSGTCGTYAIDDVQDAIWAILGQIGLEDIGDCALEIYDAAQNNGHDFTPKCGDLIAVILVPTAGQQILVAQVTAIQVGLPGCGDYYTICGEETAWGLADWADEHDDVANSCEFPKGTGWGTYFKCCSGDSDECNPEEVLSSDAFYEFLVAEEYDECVIEHYFPNN